LHHHGKEKGKELFKDLEERREEVNIYTSIVVTIRKTFKPRKYLMNYA